jgi:hypothetical protein
LNGFGSAGWVVAGAYAGALADAAGVCDSLVVSNSGPHFLRSSVSDAALTCTGLGVAAGAAAATGEVVGEAVRDVASDDGSGDDGDDDSEAKAGPKPKGPRPPGRPRSGGRREDDEPGKYLYRGGGDSPFPWAPRLGADTVEKDWPDIGASMFDTVERTCQGNTKKYWKISIRRVSQIPGLTLIQDPDDSGHYFLRPNTYEELVAWAATRGTMDHPFSRAFFGAQDGNYPC